MYKRKNCPTSGYLNEAEEIPDIILVEYPAVSTATSAYAGIEKSRFQFADSQRRPLVGQETTTPG